VLKIELPPDYLREHPEEKLDSWSVNGEQESLSIAT